MVRCPSVHYLPLKLSQLFIEEKKTDIVLSYPIMHGVCPRPFPEISVQEGRILEALESDQSFMVVRSVKFRGGFVWYDCDIFIKRNVPLGLVVEVSTPHKINKTIATCSYDLFLGKS